jgi:hypothetical protein
MFGFAVEATEQAAREALDRVSLDEPRSYPVLVTACPKASPLSQPKGLASVRLSLAE